MLIDSLFDVRQQFRSVLDFVEDDRGRERIEEAPGIGRHSRANIGRFQGYVLGSPAKQALQQSRLARLPGACQNDCRELAGGPFDHSFQRAPDVVRVHSKAPACNYAFKMNNCNIYLFDGCNLLLDKDLEASLGSYLEILREPIGGRQQGASSCGQVIQAV